MMAPRMRIAWRKPGEGGIMGASLGYPVNSSLALWLPQQRDISEVNLRVPTRVPQPGPAPAVQVPIPVWAAPPTRACVSCAAATYCRTGGVSDQEPCPQPQSCRAAGADPLSLPPPQPARAQNKRSHTAEWVPTALPAPTPLA